MAGFFALALHGALALPLLSRSVVIEEESDARGAVLIELQPLPVAAADNAGTMATKETAASEATQGQPAQEASPQTADAGEMLPPSVTRAPEDLQLPMASPIESKEEPDPQKQDVPVEERQATATPPSAQSVAEAAQAPSVAAAQQAEVAVAASQGASDRQRKKALEAWQREILTAIARHRSYPAAARQRGLEGTTVVSFAIDRYGRLMASAMHTSSGNEILDRAALATLERVHEFPTVPSAVPGVRFEFVIPVKFTVKKSAN